MDAFQIDMSKKTYKEDYKWLKKFQSEMGTCEQDTPKQRYLSHMVEDYQEALESLRKECHLSHEEMMA